MKLHMIAVTLSSLCLLVQQFKVLKVVSLRGTMRSCCLELYESVNV